MPLKEKLNVTVPLEMRVMAYRADPRGEAPELVVRQKGGQGESVDHSHYWGFLRKRQSRVKSIGLAGLNNSGGFCGVEPVFSFLMPGQI